MANNHFDFKQFRVEQSRAAMKVGTDGVLLGAWARLSATDRRILDIGAGTGVIALMAAQRCPRATVDAVEIDPAAAEQARENVRRSPWADRIHIYNTSVQDFTGSADGYDHLLANPPFFVDSLKAPDAARSAARHTDTLSPDELAAAAERLLAPGGRFSVVYPTAEALAFERLAQDRGLCLTRCLRVRGTPQGAFKRTLMEFSRHEEGLLDEELTIEHSPQNFTEEYRRLTRDFYLKF